MFEVGQAAGTFKQINNPTVKGEEPRIVDLLARTELNHAKIVEQIK